MKNKYNDITVRLVEKRDASFILSIRNDEKKSRYLSKTPNDLKLQEEWIIKYKQREKIGNEFYFIASDDKDNVFATYRVYKIETGIPEIGSWVTKPSYDNPRNSMRLDILVKNFVFNELLFDKIQFEVRKENRSVNMYHRLFSPVLVSEDYLNNYYILEKDIFNNICPQLEIKFKL